MFPMFIKPAGLGASGVGTFSPTISTLRGQINTTALSETPLDDASINVGIPVLGYDIGFPFPLFGDETTYQSNIFVSSNSYLTFGFGSSEYRDLSATVPGTAFLVGGADRSWRGVYGGSDAPDSYRVRWEGYSASSTGFPTDSIWELTMFADGVMMLVTGSIFTGGTSMLTKGDGIIFVNYTLMPNSSIVFRPDGNGSYIVDTGSYG